MSREKCLKEGYKFLGSFYKEALHELLVMKPIIGFDMAVFGTLHKASHIYNIYQVYIRFN